MFPNMLHYHMKGNCLVGQRNMPLFTCPSDMKRSDFFFFYILGIYPKGVGRHAAQLPDSSAEVPVHKCEPSNLARTREYQRGN